MLLLNYHLARFVYVIDFYLGSRKPCGNVKKKSIERSFGKNQIHHCSNIRRGRTSMYYRVYTHRCEKFLEAGFFALAVIEGMLKN